MGCCPGISNRGINPSKFLGVKNFKMSGDGVGLIGKLVATVTHISTTWTWAVGNEEMIDTSNVKLGSDGSCA